MGSLTNPAPAGAGSAGTPVLYGPYVVDYTDIPHDGDTLTLWTPQVGDVLLRLFPDSHHVTQWDVGGLWIGQNVAVDDILQHNVVAYAGSGDIGLHGSSALDNLATGLNQNATDADGTGWVTTAALFATADPVHILLAKTSAPGDPPIDPTQGHVAIFALVARAVAP